MVRHFGRSVHLLQMDIAQKHQIVLIEPLKRVAVRRVIQSPVLEPGSCNGAMKECDPMRDVFGKVLDGRKLRQLLGDPRGRVGQQCILNGHQADPNVLDLVAARLVEVVEIGDIVGR